MATLADCRSVINDRTRICILQREQPIIQGMWRDDRIFDWMDKPADMLVYDGQANELNVYVDGGRKEEKC